MKQVKQLAMNFIDDIEMEIFEYFEKHDIKIICAFECLTDMSIFMNITTDKLEGVINIEYYMNDAVYVDISYGDDEPKFKYVYNDMKFNNLEEALIFLVDFLQKVE